MSHILVVNATESITGDDEYFEIVGHLYIYRERSPSAEEPRCRSSCAMIGVPCEMTREPFAPDILKYTVIRDIDLHGFKTIVLDFVRTEPMESFSRLYLNSHFPAYPNAPPCLVMQLGDLISVNDPVASSPTFTLHKCIDDWGQAEHIEEKNSGDSPSYSGNSLAFSSSTHSRAVLSVGPPDDKPSHGRIVFPTRPDVVRVSVDGSVSNELKERPSPLDIACESYAFEEGTGRLDLLSPPPPPRLRLPSCPVCLRRIKSCVSGVSGAEELIVGPAFSGNGDRCPVCFVSSDEGEAKRVCGVCGLHENLWTCLQCGYVGCGRYTAQHAKKHFHNKGHPFSLELVSQRIWDYVNDTFVHIVFSQTLADMDASREHSDRTPLVLQSSARNPTSLPSALLLQQSQQEPFPVGGVLDDNGAENTRTRATWMVEKPVDMIDTHREYIMQHLDSAVVDKLSYLQTDYERLLEQQLLDQRLHYEKLIARETVRLLEVGIRVRNGSISSVGAPSHDRKGDCLGGGGEEASGENADRVAADLEIIENLKLEISALEYDYAETLQKIRLEEKETLAARKENDRLLKEQSIMKQRVAECTARINEIQWKEKDETASLEQQIRDIEFYIRTQKEINESPLRNEVQQGVVIVQEGAAGPGRSSAGSSSSRGSGKKKRAK